MAIKFVEELEGDQGPKLIVASLELGDGEVSLKVVGKDGLDQYICSITTDGMLRLYEGLEMEGLQYDANGSILIESF